MLALLLGSAPAAMAGEELPVLRTIPAVLELSNEKASTNPEVNATGVVTYVDTSWGSLFLSDGTRGIYVSAPLE